MLRRRCRNCAGKLNQSKVICCVLGEQSIRLRSAVTEQKQIRLAEWMATNVTWLGQKEVKLGLKGTVLLKKEEVS